MTEQLPRDAIVVGVDSSTDSDLALDWALNLARHTHQPVHAVHVQPFPPVTVTQDERGGHRWAESSRGIVTAAILRGRQMHGVPMSGQSLEDVESDPGEALVELCRGASMLVVGARGHGAVVGLLAGSVSQYAARHATCPVVAVRPAHDRDAQRVVVGVDYTPEADEAIGFAFQLASDLRAELTAIHTWPAASLHGAGTKVLPMPADVGTEVHDQHQALADELAVWQQKFPTVPVTVEAVPGHAGSVLVDASEHAGIIVVGSRQHHSVTGVLLSSVSEKVLHHARCPVVIARGTTNPGGLG
jgi:nucleotide-binding universal stress UspA family protein